MEPLRRSPLVLVAAAALALSSCTGDDVETTDPTAADTETTAATQTATVTETATPTPTRTDDAPSSP